MTLADDARRLNLRAQRCGGNNAAARHQRRGRLPALILLTDEWRLADPSTAVARLPRGSAVIFRHYGLPPGARAALARKLRALTRQRGILLLVAATGGPADHLAHAIHADGVHLAEWLVRRGPWRARRGERSGWLVTAAAHSTAALRLAAARGADAVLLSPVFATISHQEGRPLGARRFAAWTRASRIPVYALGGIDARSAPRLRPTRACGLAGIGGLVPAVDRGPRRG